MRSLFVHDHIFLHDGKFYYSKSGLPQGVLSRYADAFDYVDVVCRAVSRPTKGLSPIVDERISFSPMHNIRSATGLTKYMQVCNAISEKVKSSDVVVARLPSTLGLIAVRQARRHAIPCIIEVVGNAYEANILHGSLLGALVAPIEHYLARKEILCADDVIYITENYLQSIYRSRGNTYVCPNVEVSRAEESVVNERIKRYCESKGVFRIGLIGSLDVNYKGHQQALSVVKNLRSKYNIRNVELVFAGGGDQARWRKVAIENGVGPSLRMDGVIPPGKSMMRWIDGIDMLLQPSLTEGQGRSIIEGMSRGCPVVASCVGGIPELLDGSMLSDPENVERLTDICAALVSSPELLAVQSRRNWAKSSQFDAGLVERTRRIIFSEIRRRLENARS